MSKKVSVVIPVKNEGKNIRQCIEGILNQTVKVEEIIVLDSGSTDGTLEILQEYSIVSIMNISPDEFNHGETRNIGIRKAMGDYLLLTVGDAVAVDNHLIENLLSCFDDDKVACVYGQQIVPHDLDKNPMEWFMPITKNPKPEKHYVGSKENFDSLPSDKKMRSCSIDNVVAMYKKEIMIQFPFLKITYGEDITWARIALISGFSLVFNPNARVYHYHKTNAEFNYKRTFSVLYLKNKLFNYVPVLTKDFLFPLRVIKKLISLKRIKFKEKINWFFYNLNQRRAIRNAENIFLKTIKQDSKKLDILFEEINGKPPIPVK